MAMIARVHPFKPSEQSTNGQHGQSVHNGQNAHYRIEDVTDDPKVAVKASRHLYNYLNHCSTKTSATTDIGTVDMRREV